MKYLMDKKNSQTQIFALTRKYNTHSSQAEIVIALWLKVKSFHENLWKQNLSKQKHHMLLLFPWFLEHFTIP